MESLTSAEAAARLGIPVWKFHREIAPRLAPVWKAPGLRGAKSWNAADIERLVLENHRMRTDGEGVA